MSRTDWRRRALDAEEMLEVLLHEHDTRVQAHRAQTPQNRMRSLRAHEAVDLVVRQWRAKKDNE